MYIFGKLFIQIVKLESYILMEHDMHRLDRVQPILYERVVLRSPESAKAFFRTLRSKPLRYFDRKIKSLAFDSSIPMAQAKPILVECSKFVILLSIFRQGDSPGIFLPFVNSPILRRLTLVERGPKPDSPRRMLSVRPEVFSSVTHLAIIRDLRQSLWDNLANTTGIRPWGTPENEEAGRLALKSLTHLAVSANTIYGEVEMDLLRRAAPNLKYLALLEASNIAPSKHEQLMMFLRSRSEHLRLVVMQNIGSTDAWNVEDFFRPSDFWTKVEKLIDDGYLSDRGDRWLPLRYSDPQSDAWRARHDSNKFLTLQSSPFNDQVEMTEAQDVCMSSELWDGPYLETASETTKAFVFELPNEIQRIIFEYAATLDGKCAFRLCQVAKYVNTWIHPILYQRVVLQDPQAAVSLFQTLRSKPRGYFEPLIRSLAFASTVTLPQARALLVECSRRLLLLTVFRKSSSKERILDYVKTPYLRRLTMVCRRDWAPGIRFMGSPNAQYDIPLGIVASLTHLAIVVDHDYGNWNHLSQATMAPMYPNNETYVSAYSAFQNLTHVATSVKALTHQLKIKRVAKKLKYFAILEPKECTEGEHQQLLLRVRTIEKDASYHGAPRCMVILKDLGDPEAWDVTDSFRPSEFWKMVERLVDEGYISDREEKWSRYRAS
ncbi:hypothetical protein CVT26_000082 [Gymnopilus dilepis]|uniref:Uncharacterized protein n=1 Tax=Gymnopilus dilepis TaxID=231916 RepID=A0A409VGR4_9AGAR|nr:hypothetical protein CVT26_000082 [Gymnopilus dilepis]